MTTPNIHVIVNDGQGHQGKSQGALREGHCKAHLETQQRTVLSTRTLDGGSASSGLCTALTSCENVCMMLNCPGPQFLSYVRGMMIVYLPVQTVWISLSISNPVSHSFLLQL